MSNIFFTSDQHYQSPSIIRVCARPFSSVEEMNETMIERHNAVVRPGDRVYNLGDMYLGRRSGVRCQVEEAKELHHRLNGQQFLIIGNHEEIAKYSMGLTQYFVWQKYLHRLRIEGKPDTILCHYAMRSWEKKIHGSWHLYGHSHGKLPEDGSLSFDVGVDCWDFRPVSLEEVEQKMNVILSKGTADGNH